MISIPLARKITGTYLKNQTDEQVQDLLNQMSGMAEITFDQVIARGSNRTREVIESDDRKEQNGSRT